MKIANTIAYCFAVVSAIAAIYMIYVTAIDFFNPNSISFQQLNLTDSQILILDSVIIICNLFFLVLLFITMKRRKMAMMIITSFLIWIFATVDIFVEQNFHIKV